MTKSELLDQRRNDVLAIARKYGAISIRLFGSVARGDSRPDSDVDFLVELEEGRSLLDLGGLQSELQSALGCRVDVVTPNGLRPRLRPGVLEEAVTL